MNQIIQVIENYRILKSHPIGAGATGSVYYGQNKEGVKVAVKSIDFNKITKGIEKQIQNQIKNLTSLQSPFIVKLYEYFRSKQSIYMVLQYCEDGDLKHYLDKNRKNQGLSQNQALTFMRHLMHGYSALLKKNIIHRDIKPANILLKQGVAKLSDFGFSRVVQDPNKTQKLTLLGTPLYTAPEILANKQFSNKCDVWSMGIVFYEMLHGRTPWGGTDIQNLKHNIQKRPLQFKHNITKEIKEIISKMLQKQTQQRAKWQQLLQNQLFLSPGNLALQKQKSEISFSEAKKILIEYLKNFLVKSYLIIYTKNQVSFAPNTDPLEQSLKSQDKILIQKQTNQLTRRRNYAFLHMYILALYEKNKNIIPKQVNYYMELQYSLIKRTFDLIYKIHQDFNSKNQKQDQRWAKYMKTPQYTQLNMLLENDFKLLNLLLNSCMICIEQKIKKKQLSKETKDIYQEFKSNFKKIFDQAIKTNSKALKESNAGVCMLIYEYLTKYILYPQQILLNAQLDFASFYEKRQKDYGLS